MKMMLNKDNSFEKALEKLGLNNLTADEEIYRPWVLYNRPRELLKPHEYYFLAYLRNLRKRTHVFGFSDLSSFSGVHQSGKSSTACLFAWLLDETFKDNFYKRVVYDPSDLDEYILNADKLHSLDKNNVGCAVVVDEAGNTVEALNYYSEFSRKFNTTLQTMGYLKPRIFFISPLRKNVASSIRDMANTHYNVVRPNTREYSLVAPRHMKYDNINNKSWTKRPIVRYYNEKVIINNLKIWGIPSEILKKYKEVEKYKSENIQKKYTEVKENEEKKLEQIDIEQLVEKTIDNLPGFLNSKENGISSDALHYQFKIPVRACNVLKLRVERKLKQDGYIFPGKNQKRNGDDNDE